MDDRFDGFAVNLYLDDDDAWLAHFVDLPEVPAFGDTPEAAFERVGFRMGSSEKGLSGRGVARSGGPGSEEIFGGF